MTRGDAARRPIRPQRSVPVLPILRIVALLAILGGIGAAVTPGMIILGYGIYLHPTLTGFFEWTLGLCKHRVPVGSGYYECSAYHLPAPPFYEPSTILRTLLSTVGLRGPIPHAVVDWIVAIVVVVVLLHFVLISVTLIIYILRKVIGYMQARLGPMRVGPKGILQTVADAVKLMAKEDVIPTKADKVMFTLAPIIVFVPALLLYVVIPFGEGKHFIAKDLNIGVLYLVAISSITVIGIIVAGWASDNKYALLGGMRAAAQLVSYEVPGVLVVLGPVIMAGTLSMRAIVERQKLDGWYIWAPVPLIGFVIYFISALAETNTTPFDLPEAESELVAGYNVEYSGMKFGLFFLAEFANSFTVCAIAVTLFWGGWLAPMPFKILFGLILAASIGLFWMELAIIPRWLLAAASLVVCVAMPDTGWGSVFWFIMKASALQFFMMWIRATYPRVRVDQLMEFAWKFLLPLSLVYLAAVGLWAAVYQK